MSPLDPFVSNHEAVRSSMAAEERAAGGDPIVWAGRAAFKAGQARRCPSELQERASTARWYDGYDQAAAETPGTMQHEAAQRLAIFPLRTRVRIVGYENRLGGQSRLNGRTGVVHDAQFGGIYVLLDKRPREKAQKLQLITWSIGEPPTLEIAVDEDPPAAA